MLISYPERKANPHSHLHFRGSVCFDFCPLFLTDKPERPNLSGNRVRGNRAPCHLNTRTLSRQRLDGSPWLKCNAGREQQKAFDNISIIDNKYVVNHWEIFRSFESFENWRTKDFSRLSDFVVFFQSLKHKDSCRFPVKTQQCMLVPTHIFKPGNMGTAGRTGGTICSFSSRTWGLWMAGKKRHPISKIPLSGPSCEEFPPLQLLLCPLLLSSSLLFFFNQAVWGCQVFWDEDSQPCEKLIPCGPSSLWRSSPWEHWWWLAGRWWSAEGGGMDGEMKGAWTEGHLTSRLSSSDSNSDSEAHTWSYIYAVPPSPPPLKHHIHTSILSSTPVNYLPTLCQSPTPRPFDEVPFLTIRRLGWRAERIYDVEGSSSGLWRMTVVHKRESALVALCPEPPWQRHWPPPPIHPTPNHLALIVSP